MTQTGWAYQFMYLKADQLWKGGAMPPGFSAHNKGPWHFLRGLILLMEGIPLDGLQTFIGVLLGGGILGFVEFMIKRHDNKHDKHKEVVDAIKDLSKKVDKLEEKIDSVADKGEEREAVQSRIRLLRNADELQEGRRHTKDWFDQAMSDITVYEKFCVNHPEFKNHQTEATVDYIKRVYAERLDKHDFYVRTN